MPSLDQQFVRAQFPAFAEPTLRDQCFFENAGGSYACTQVIERLSEYYRRLKVQPYYRYPASLETGARMDDAHQRLAGYLGVSAAEVHFGPSTSQNLYVLAQALRLQLKPGDEIVVTQQDHEANQGVWRRLAGDGIVIREWAIDADSGELTLAGLEREISSRTRVVAFTQCSNILGQINPVAEICARVRAAGALSVVDGVSYAPHGFPDVAALGADIYLFSLYKTYGPHQGLMVLRGDVLERLGNQGHYFNGALPHKRMVPAGPDHAQIAAAAGIADYFDALDTHHGGTADVGRPARVRALLAGVEATLTQRILDALGQRSGLRLLGPVDAAHKAPTIAVDLHRIAPADAVEQLGQRGIMAAGGHFYAVRLLEAMGLDPARGVLRLSLAHYNSHAEVDRLLTALDALK
ncbi:MAG: aminotransferase class V-fold PLP-dependent enzyme [Pseudomonadota bacterium]|nr:aminotransferase class V-fold PLP-dependent enzyme [Pseudomonadota bacterium]